MCAYTHALCTKPFSAGPDRAIYMCVLYYYYYYYIAVRTHIRIVRGRRRLSDVKYTKTVAARRRVFFFFFLYEGLASVRFLTFNLISVRTVHEDVSVTRAHGHCRRLFQQQKVIPNARVLYITYPVEVGPWRKFCPHSRCGRVSVATTSSSPPVISNFQHRSENLLLPPFYARYAQVAFFKVRNT